MHGWQRGFGKSLRVTYPPQPPQRSAHMKSSGFDTLGSIMGLGTILRISFLECRSPAVDLRFIFLYRVAGTPQLVSTWDSLPAPALGSRQRKYRMTSVSNGSKSWRMPCGRSPCCPAPTDCPESYVLLLLSTSTITKGKVRWRKWFTSTAKCIHLHFKQHKPCEQGHSCSSDGGSDPDRLRHIYHVFLGPWTQVSNKQRNHLWNSLTF